jgi:hypothetical protein
MYTIYTKLFINIRLVKMLKVCKAVSDLVNQQQCWTPSTFEALAPQYVSGGLAVPVSVLNKQCRKDMHLDHNVVEIATDTVVIPDTLHKAKQRFYTVYQVKLTKKKVL